MKKVALGLAVFFLLSLVIASAVEIKLSKSVYSPQETLQAEINGEFLDALLPENIYFYRERNIPLEYDLLKASDKYYLYAILPDSEGNYTMKIKGVRYMENRAVASSDIPVNFSIAGSNGTVLSFNPGFVFAREDFSIKFISNKDLEASAEFLGTKQDLSLIKDKEQKVTFSIKSVSNYTQTSVKILGYEIPVFILKNGSSEAADRILRFSPLKLDSDIILGNPRKFVVALVNFGDSTEENIQLSANFSSKDLDLKLNPVNITKIEGSEKEFINITVNPKVLGDINATILAYSNNYSVKMPIFLYVVENNSGVLNNNSNSSSGYITKDHCTDPDKVCNYANESCSVETYLTYEGDCCSSTCKARVIKPDPGSGGGGSGSGYWFLGIIFCLILVAVGYGYYKKRKSKPVDILKKKEQEFQNRMQSLETKDNLTRI